MDRDSLLSDPETSMRVALDGRQAQIWTALPCIVDSVDFSTMTLEAQPAIQGVISNPDGTESFVNLPLLVDVPICFPSAGGFSLTLPIKKNDEVLIIIASRCIDSWFQNGGVGVPMENRMHDLSDGFAIPGPRSQPRVLSGISSNHAQLRNDAGDVYLEIRTDGKVKIITTAGLQITGDVSVTGKVTASGNVESSGGDVKAGLISLSNHTHLVTTAPGTTGPALP